MSNIVKESLKASKKEEKKLQKKIKSINKNENLSEDLFKSKIKIEEYLENKEAVSENQSSAEGEINVPKFNAVYINLPSEATKDELINFLSNRGIVIDNLLINENKYAILETENSDMFNKVSQLIHENPMENNAEMKVSQLFGNQVKLSTFIAKHSVAQKRIVLVKNINVSSKVEDILANIEHTESILKHNSVKVINRGVKTQMLTIEFRNSEQTDSILRMLNTVELDGHKLSAEYKNNLVDYDVSEAGDNSDTLIIRNLPISCDGEFVKELVRKFNVHQKNIHVAKKPAKKCCLIKFNNVVQAKEAYEMLMEGPVEGVRLDLKFVTELNDQALTKNKLQLTNLCLTTKKDDIEKEFDMIESLKFPLTISGKSKGCCYLSFSSDKIAALAYDCFQDKLIKGRKIKCAYIKTGTTKEHADDNNEVKIKREKIKPVGTVLTLFNLPAGVTPKDIIANFNHVKLVNIVKKGESFKGIAEVHFKDSTAAQEAMSTAEFSLKGRVIRKELKGGDWRIGTAPKKVKVTNKIEVKVEKNESDSMEN